MKLSERLTRLESGSLVPELEVIPADATLDEALRIYDDNLRRCNGYKVPARAPAADPMTLEQATAIYTASYSAIEQSINSNGRQRRRKARIR